MIREILQLRRFVVDGSVDESIAKIREMALKLNANDIVEEIEAVASTYSLMKQYMMKGFEDRQREELFQQLRVKVFESTSKLLANAMLERNTTYRSSKKSLTNTSIDLEQCEQKLIWHSQELAIKSLVEDERHKQEIGNLQFEYRKSLFNLIYTSSLFTSAEVESIERAMLSPMVEIADKRLITCALMLAQQVVFDIRKFLLLVDVCTGTTDDDVRQLALIAIVFGRPDIVEQHIYAKEIETSFSRLTEIENIKGDLVELQLQILLCTDTEKAEKTISKDIMPTLKSGAATFNKRKTENEMLDELLNPDKEDRMMDEVEKSVEKIRNMQKSGVDIFFGGFSQAKRFPFFYNIVNWFLPFYADHPQLANINIGGIPKDVLEKLLNAQAFCSSDKYSFYLTLSMVHNQIPKDFIDAVSKGETVSELGHDIVRDKSYNRLMMLQDLYRFYKLYSNKQDFKDPFATDESAVFFYWSNVVEMFKDTKYPYNIARQLLNRNYFNALNKLMEANKDELNPSYLKLKALGEYKQQNYHSALFWFEKIKMMEPDNKTLSKRMADTAFMAGDYYMAQHLYDEYIRLAGNDENTEFQLYRLAICHLHHKDAQEAANIIYRLYYEHEDNPDYMSALAWQHLLNAEYQSALNVYEKIDKEYFRDKDAIRKSLTLWKLNRKNEAVNELRKYVEKTYVKTEIIHQAMSSEVEKCNIGISNTDLKILADIIYDKNINHFS